VFDSQLAAASRSGAALANCEFVGPPRCFLPHSQRPTACRESLPASPPVQHSSRHTRSRATRCARSSSRHCRAMFDAVTGQSPVSISTRRPARQLLVSRRSRTSWQYISNCERKRRPSRPKKTRKQHWSTRMTKVHDMPRTRRHPSRVHFVRGHPSGMVEVRSAEVVSVSGEPIGRFRDWPQVSLVIRVWAARARSDD